MGAWTPAGKAAGIESTSGTAATIAQLSVIALPALTPPWSRSPLLEPRVDAHVEAVPVLELLAEVRRVLHDVADLTELVGSDRTGR